MLESIKRTRRTNLNDIANTDEVERRECDPTPAESINKMLQELPPVSEEYNIYRIPRRLLHRNLTAYTPQIISIGPFHHGRQDLMAMEQLKLRCLKSYLHRTNLRIEIIVGIVQSWEKSARNCYAEPINMDSDNFVKMMLVDGCFIVELMTSVCRIFTKTQGGLDPLFFTSIITDLFCDLRMLENQLPFFVLQALFDQFSLSSLSFIEVTHRFYNLRSIRELPHNVSTKKVSHLVDFLSFYYTPSIVVPAASGNSGRENKPMFAPPTATELWEAGVAFKKATQDKHIMDISFKDRVLEIPPFEIDDIFETYVRNLMAFEQFCNDRQYAIQCFLFLNGLISTEQDVNQQYWWQ